MCCVGLVGRGRGDGVGRAGVWRDGMEVRRRVGVGEVLFGDWVGWLCSVCQGRGE